MNDYILNTTLLILKYFWNIFGVLMGNMMRIDFGRFRYALCKLGVQITDAPDIYKRKNKGWLLGLWGVIGMMEGHDSKWRVVNSYTRKVRVLRSNGSYMVKQYNKKRGYEAL